MTTCTTVVCCAALCCAVGIGRGRWILLSLYWIYGTNNNKQAHSGGTVSSQRTFTQYWKYQVNVDIVITIVTAEQVNSKALVLREMSQTTELSIQTSR